MKFIKSLGMAIGIVALAGLQAKAASVDYRYSFSGNLSVIQNTIGFAAPPSTVSIDVRISVNETDRFVPDFFSSHTFTVLSGTAFVGDDRFLVTHGIARHSLFESAASSFFFFPDPGNLLSLSFFAAGSSIQGVGSNAFRLTGAAIPRRLFAQDIFPAIEGDYDQFFIDFSNTDFTGSFSASVNDVTLNVERLSAVPLPAGFLLLLTALTGLGFLTWRYRVPGSRLAAGN